MPQNDYSGTCDVNIICYNINTMVTSIIMSRSLQNSREVSIKFKAIKNLAVAAVT